MRTLPRPSDETGAPYQAREVFRLCISRVGKVGLKARLAAIESMVAEAADLYDTLAATGALHQISPADHVNKMVTNEEMVGVYAIRMVPVGRPGRPIYERIKAAAPHLKCPLCDIGTVTTLDHQLPKTKFSCHTVMPNNLVPACMWCQDAKGDFYPTTDGQQTIHPYFDNFENESWLSAEVISRPTVGFVFSVTAPPEWNATRKQRAEQHLKTYELNKLYATNAADEMASRLVRFTELLHRGGAAEVRASFVEEARILRSSRRNSWRLATYEAAARSDWFCAGGFRDLGT